MRIVDLKIGTKTMGGFLAVVLIFIGVAAYQISNLGMLARLQDEGAGRARDAVKVLEVDMRADEAYTVMADGFINRDFEETQKNFAELKEGMHRSRTRNEMHPDKYHYE